MVQASESGSADELQSPLLEWQEAVSESEDMHPEIREEKTAMALRMAQIEEEREGELICLKCYYITWMDCQILKAH